jgi:NTE family protein
MKKDAVQAKMAVSDPSSLSENGAKTGRPRVGLALGGGVIRGFAHLGALAVLEEEEIPIDMIAGASAGAILGSIYAAGLPLPMIEKVADQITWWRLATPNFGWEGLVSFDKLERWLIDLIGDLHFQDLALPFVAVATDLETGEAVTLDSGPLAPAVRASCSVPGIVTPRHLNGRVLGDGGISNNLPVSPLRRRGANYVIGVDLFIPTYQRPWLGPLGRGAAAIEILVEHAGGGTEEADCLIEPDLSATTYVRTSAAAGLIARGREAALACLPQIREALGRAD